MDALSGVVALDDHAAACLDSDDALDAVICALVGRAARCCEPGRPQRLSVRERDPHSRGLVLGRWRRGGSGRVERLNPPRGVENVTRTASAHAVVTFRVAVTCNVTRAVDAGAGVTFAGSAAADAPPSPAAVDVRYAAAGTPTGTPEPARAGDASANCGGAIAR